MGHSGWGGSFSGDIQDPLRCTLVRPALEGSFDCKTSRGPFLPLPSSDSMKPKEYCWYFFAPQLPESKPVEEKPSVS